MVLKLAIEGRELALFSGIEKGQDLSFILVS